MSEILKSTSPGNLPEVLFQPALVRCTANRGQKLLEIAALNGIALRSECGGRGVCGKCKVRVTPPEGVSPLKDEEIRVLGDKAITEDLRLACQAQLTGSITVQVQAESFDGAELFGKNRVEGSELLEPAVHRFVLESVDTAEPQGQGTNDLLRLVRSCIGIEADHLSEESVPSPAALKQIAKSFDLKGSLTVSHHYRMGIIAVRSGARRRSLGFAIDIGTTTVAAHLCDLETGNVLTSAASSNPQRPLGEDVIARISYCQNHDEGTQILQDLIVKEVSALVDHCLSRVSARRDDVDDITVVGNTTMVRIFLGINPQALGRHPYLPVTCSAIDCRAEEIGLTPLRNSTVHVLPVVSGFIGADTLGTILSQRPHADDAISLIVDCGTNGELVLGNRDFLLATSCATGPAFEGGHISCGMRATERAVHRVRIDPHTRAVSYQVIGSEGTSPPVGLCGSGVIDAVAEMLRAGIVLPKGRLQEGAPGVISDERGVGIEFVLVSREKTRTGNPICLTLSDVRQLQLAKAAVATGIRFLLREAGVTRIDRMVLTGTFGANFTRESAEYIGMLPPGHMVMRTQVVENAAGHGAVLSLLDVGIREEAARLARKIQVLELAEKPDFNEEFVSATPLGSWVV